MSNLRFEYSVAGFNEMRNMPGVQQACLNKAQAVAATAGASAGRAFSCDVEAGKTRCHARAFCEVAMNKSWQGSESAFKKVAKAGADAAIAHGGEAC